MHGGQRDKRCRLWCSGLDLNSLAVMCDGSHSHLPWGLAHESSKELFATAEERKYPLLFCQRLARLVSEQLLGQRTPGVSGKTATQMQPRRGGNEAVPEFKRVVEVSVDNLLPDSVKKGETVQTEHGLGKILDVLDERAATNGSK
eukprot:10661543-Karenia_brevis.AAC.1